MKTTTFLYNKTVPLVFDDDKHHYTIKDRTVDGVTSILKILDKPALIPWAVNQAVGYVDKNLPVGVALDELQKKQLLDEAKKIYRKTASDAADLGTLTHEWCEKWIKGMNPDMPTNEILRQNAENFVKWATERKVDFKASERKVYSKKHDYCGTADIFGRIDGKAFVGDIKTSSGIYDEMLLQISAYSGAVEEEFGEGADVGIIIRCGKDGSFEIKEWSREELEGAFKAFLGTLEVYRFLKNLKFNSKKK